LVYIPPFLVHCTTKNLASLVLFTVVKAQRCCHSVDSLSSLTCLASKQLSLENLGLKQRLEAFKNRPNGSTYNRSIFLNGSIQMIKFTYDGTPAYVHMCNAIANTDTSISLKKVPTVNALTDSCKSDFYQICTFLRTGNRDDTYDFSIFFAEKFGENCGVFDSKPF
jgi:hypothetical protein